jgi:sigma-B regulation protein RsbU (phosphoserine phosphatase)
VKILIAEDDATCRRVLEANLADWGFDVVSTRDGCEAWTVLQRSGDINLAILDYQMPEMDGLEVCRRVRWDLPARPIHLIMLTTRSASSDVVSGLSAGADDFVSKPFNRDELRARILAGARIVNLQRELAERVGQLHESLERVRKLEGMLPMCSYCKKVRDEKNSWQQVEVYIAQRSEAKVSHGVCPGCYEKFLEPELSRLEGGACSQDA